MSMIIKGMKMPKSCDSCDLIQFDDEELESHCPLSPYYRWCGTPPDYRPEGCPLVEVPTPYGRLIDSDALKKTIESIYGGALWTFDCFECIRKAPTIIEAEVSE